MHRYRILLGAVALFLAAGQHPAAQQPHRWNADYTLGYRALPVAGDSVADGLYAFTYAWEFGILNGEDGPLGPSRIIVQRAPGLGPLQADIRPGVMFDPTSSAPNLIFSRAMLAPRPSELVPDPGPPPPTGVPSLFFGGLVSQLPVPGLHELGFDVTRTLVGGREVAAGATELRTFELTFTVRDSALTNMQGGINFQPFTPGPPPVTADVIACGASSNNPARVLGTPAIDHPTENVIWDVTDAGATEPLPVGESYTITCTVSLTNNNAAAPATYMPAAHASGHINRGSVETLEDFVHMPTDPLGYPPDPLGAVRFEVTGPSPILAALTTRFSRRAALRPVNDLCRGSVRITVSGPAGGGPIQLAVNGPEGPETLPLPLGVTEFSGVDPGMYDFVATAPAGFDVTPATTQAAVACGELTELFFTVAVTNTVPVFTAPLPITQEATGAAGAVVSFTVAGDDAEDGPLAAVCAPASGSTFPIGTTSVSCTVTDTAGATASGTFTVTVTAPPPVPVGVRMRQAPVLNGGTRIEGSIQVMQPGSITLNGSAVVTGDLYVAGSPTVKLNGKPTFGGVVAGSGSASPSNYQVTLNGGVSLGRLITRTDAAPLTAVPAPPMPAGTRNVSLNKATDSPGAFATLRDLTLNGNVGAVSVPAGTYGRFVANGSNRFVLGTAGATTPAVYHFQQLQMNGDSRIDVVGPVVIVLKETLIINGSGYMGAAANPLWLTLKIASGGLTLNGNTAFYGVLEAPSGQVTLNGGKGLTGRIVSAERLTLNGSSKLVVVDF